MFEALNFPPDILPVLGFPDASLHTPAVLPLKTSVLKVRLFGKSKPFEHKLVLIVKVAPFGGVIAVKVAGVRVVDLQEANPTTEVSA